MKNLLRIYVDSLWSKASVTLRYGESQIPRVTITLRPRRRPNHYRYWPNISRGRARTVGRMEQDTEFESAISPWKGDVLPLHQSCIKELSIFFLSDAASFTPKYCRHFNVAIIYCAPLIHLTSGAQLVQVGRFIHPRKFCGWGYRLRSYVLRVKAECTTIVLSPNLAPYGAVLVLIF